MPQDLVKGENKVYDLFVILIIIVLSAFKSYCQLQESGAFSVNSANNIHFSTGNISSVILLWWTDKLFMHLKPYETINCKTGSCDSTKLKKYQQDPRTRGFIFYGTDVNGEELPLPRKWNHEWALIHEESPMNNYILSHSTMMRLFNHTATFSRYSDYPLTSQFIYSLDYLRRTPISLSIKNELKKNGLAPVLYVQSHCNIASDRDRYVKELMKYISIDSYGECLHNKDLPENLRDTLKFEDKYFLNFIANYKFHIAFENSLCKDYMTEKLFRSLHVGSIPIYRGSSTAKDWMPNNHSIIMVDDFPSPRDLAAFIKTIDQNDEEYEKYMEFKKIGNIDNIMLKESIFKREWGRSEEMGINFFSGFECYVCDQILERIRKETAHFENPAISPLSPKMANNTHLGCPQPYVSFGTVNEIRPDDKWLEENWIETYWQEFDKARAVRKMLEAEETDSSKFFQYVQKIMVKQN